MFFNHIICRSVLVCRSAWLNIAFLLNALQIYFIFFILQRIFVFCLNTSCFSWIFIRIWGILILILKHKIYIGWCNVIGFIGMIIVSVPDGEHEI